MREALALWAAHVKRVVKARPPEKTLIAPRKRARPGARSVGLTSV